MHLLFLSESEADLVDADDRFLRRATHQYHFVNEGYASFDDPDGKMNLSVQDVRGAVLVVSQFTLYGDCAKGRRPGFTGAAPPAVAEPLYESFVVALKALGVPVATGRFAADMQVELVNDGPVTFVIDAPA